MVTFLTLIWVCVGVCVFSIIIGAAIARKRPAEHEIRVIDHLEDLYSLHCTKCNKVHGRNTESLVANNWEVICPGCGTRYLGIS